LQYIIRNQFKATENRELLSLNSSIFSIEEFAAQRNDEIKREYLYSGMEKPSNLSEILDFRGKSFYGLPYKL